MSHHEFSGVTVELTVGDITAQPDADAVVNAANAQLRTGGGVAGAIHRAAGPGLADECAPLAPISPGQAVITGAHGLPNRHVIHCLGPVYGSDEPSAELLASCYRTALRLADEADLGVVAFPAISTGVFGYPVRDAAAVALRTVARAAPDLTSVSTVRFVLFDQRALDAHQAALADVSGDAAR
ncbi:O-acetyl-ADP-ribose deacetylase (regulator of RNase III) [Haloactinopolyspora alba]|uniref:O-acetyl-ADP-ribose deacetylase (Regulator of RNase III) n=1 Tax=Haloactinopolyspora alba TaxID=648780 RepID=A0A2P8E5C8_9ACTN|nr:macro domain-containing protein [Haloactinopolyspora alba]PSL04676.1 O-acetyl-ADP-ribose deacetylase (regulator of RNase III) [Haloactinopolyspora alba]